MGSVVVMAAYSGRANIRQVAALAGVSHQTVSRVLNGHASIRPATRERVLAAIEELDYRPNRRGSGARDAQVEPDRGDRRQRCRVRAEQHAARARAGGSRRRVLRHIRHGRRRRPARHERCPGPLDVAGHRRALPDRPTLVIARPCSKFEHAHACTGRDRGEGRHLLDRVGRPGARRRVAVRHLIDLGHRRIAHVAGPLDWLDAWACHRAWQTEIKAAGLDELDVVVGDWTAGFGYEVAHVAGRLPDAPRCSRRTTRSRWV